MADNKLPPISYSSRDYLAIRQDLIDKIPYYISEWTDYNDSDFGIVLLSLFAAMGDVLHFYVDKSANENFLSTAVKRESLVEMLKLIDYELKGAVPAIAIEKFTIAFPLGGDLIIPAGTQVQTSGTGEPVIFETNEDATLTAGLLEVNIPITQGETSGEPVGVSNGLAYQSFELDEIPIIDNSLRIFINEGTGEELWDEVESLADYGPTDKVYSTEKSGEGKVTIFFGDNAQGKVPLNNSPIRSENRLGGGSIGNVGSNTIKTLNDTILFDSSPVAIAVTNPEAASGGSDEESIETARRQGPKSIRSLNRAVTEEDFGNIAGEVDGVGKASAEGKGFRNVDVYIAPVEGGLPNQALKDLVKAYLDVRKIVTTLIEILNPTYLKINTGGQVYILDNFVRDEIQELVEAALESIFEFDKMDFDQNIHISDVYETIEGITGVDYVDLENVTLIPQPIFNIWQGNATISEVQIGESAKDEIWVITLLSPTTFKADGSVSGLQVNTGTFGSEYISDNLEIKFTITVGAVPNFAGDNLSFRTTKKLGNISVGKGEIATFGRSVLTYFGGI